MGIPLAYTPLKPRQPVQGKEHCLSWLLGPPVGDVGPSDQTPQFQPVHRVRAVERRASTPDIRSFRVAQDRVLVPGGPTRGQGWGARAAVAGWVELACWPLPLPAIPWTGSAGCRLPPAGSPGRRLALLGTAQPAATVQHLPGHREGRESPPQILGLGAQAVQSCHQGLHPWCCHFLSGRGPHLGVLQPEPVPHDGCQLLVAGRTQRRPQARRPSGSAVVSMHALWREPESLRWEPPGGQGEPFSVGSRSRGFFEAAERALASVLRGEVRAPALTVRRG